ncbi:MAG: hypothetical protein AB1898_12535 [Acidobacteriota bacterium]
MDALNLFMRWLHIFSVITAVGATVFLRVVLVPSLETFAADTRSQLFKSLAGRLRVLIHSAITGILVSGLYNTHLLWKSSIPPYALVYSVKVVIALLVFVVGIMLTSSNPNRAAFQANRKKWLAVNAGLAALVVLLSAVLRTLHQ